MDYEVAPNCFLCLFETELEPNLAVVASCSSWAAAANGDISHLRLESHPPASGAKCKGICLGQMPSGLG